MKNILLLILAVFALGLFVAGCSTYERTADEITTTTNYADDGKTVKSDVVVEKGVKDIKEITDASVAVNSLEEADKGTASDRSGSLTSFNLGFANYGLTFKSASLNSTRAPATAAASDSVFKQMAKVKSAGKTTIQTDALGVNTDKAKAAAADQKTESK